MSLGPGTSALTPTLVDPPRIPARVDTVRRQFDRRAAGFAQHAPLAQEISARLMERLDYIKLDVTRVLDAGCGPGTSRAALLQKFPQAHWLGADISTHMLRAGRAHANSLRARAARLLPWLIGSRAEWLHADAAQLPLADGCVDLVFSNLMLHWHPLPHSVFPEWQRVLRIDGLLLFSCFGPDTLKEVRAAFAAAEPRTRPMPFVDMHDFGDMMVAAGFATPVMDVEVIRLTYADARAALRDVHWLGGNPRDDRLAHWLSSRQAHAVLDALNAQRGADGRIAVTFEVAYGHAWKPQPKQPASQAGSSIVSLDRLRAGLPGRGP